MTSAFTAGAIAMAALIYSIHGIREWRSFGKWWNADGGILWMTTAMLLIVLLWVD